jgi:hypothetical protein
MASRLRGGRATPPLRRNYRATNPIANAAQEQVADTAVTTCDCAASVKSPTTVGTAEHWASVAPVATAMPAPSATSALDAPSNRTAASGGAEVSIAILNTWVRATATEPCVDVTAVGPAADAESLRPRLTAPALTESSSASSRTLRVLKDLASSDVCPQLAMETMQRTSDAPRASLRGERYEI